MNLYPKNIYFVKNKISVENMKKRISIIIFILIYSSIIFWVSFFSCGINDDIYDYCDAKAYAVNAATLSRTFESMPIHLLTPYTWDDFVYEKRELGLGSALINPGYCIMMAGIYKLIGKCRLLYGSFVSYIFYLFGIIFMILILSRFFNHKELLFCCILICSSWLIIMNMIRPLSDPVFWGLSLFCIWFSLKYPNKHILIGAIIGVIFIFRFQGLFLYPLIFILIVQDFSVKVMIKTIVRMSIGAIPFLIIMKLIPLITGQNVAVQTINAGATFYLTSYMKLLQNFNFSAYIIKINQSIKKLSSLNVLTPIFWLLATSIFSPDENKLIIRLRWFCLLGIVSLIVVGSLGNGPSSRLYLVFFPFVIALSFQFVKTLANNFTADAKKLITPLIIIFFLFSTSSGLLSIVACYNKRSDQKFIPAEVWDSFEINLKHFKPDAVIATNYLELPFFHETRNIAILPENFRSFMNESQRNHELDGIVFVTYKNRFNHYSSWKSILKQGNITDKNNNKFIKIFEIVNPLVQIYCYQLMLSQ